MSRFFPALDEEGLPIRKPKTSAKLQHLLDEHLGHLTHNSSGKPTAPDDDDDYVSYDWTDPKTGFTYKIREKKPQGPQGDFRVKESEAHERYRAAMGLPRHVIPTGPRDQLLPDNQIEDTEAYQNVLIEDRFHRGGLARTKQQAQFEVHRDKPLDDDEEIDLKLQDRVVPHKVGLNTVYQKVQPTLTQNLRGRTDETVKPQTTQNYAGTSTNYMKDHAFSDVMKVSEILAKRDDLSQHVSSAVRGILGSSGVDLFYRTRIRKGPKREMSRDSELSRLLIEQGLVGPMTSSEIQEDPKKLDSTAYHVGLRAVESLIQAHTLGPEFMDLPKSSRDLVALAVGRSVLQITELAFKTSSDVIISERAQRQNSLIPGEKNQNRSLMADSSVRPELSITEESRLVGLVQQILSKPSMDLETLQSIVQPEILRLKDHENESSSRPSNVSLDRESSVQKPKYMTQKMGPEHVVQRVAPMVITGPEFRGTSEIPVDTFKKINDAPNRSSESRASGFFQS